MISVGNTNNFLTAVENGEMIVKFLMFGSTGTTPQLQYIPAVSVIISVPS